MNLSGLNLKGVINMRVHLQAGRTTVMAVSLVACAGVLGGVVLSKTASAQGGGSLLGRVSVFGPVQLPPISRDANGAPFGSRASEVVLLPAVRTLSTPFRLQVLSEDTNLV